MSKAARVESRSQRSARPSGAARRRAEAQRRRRNRLFLGASVAAVIALVGLVLGLHVAAGSSGGGAGSTSSAASLPVGSTAPSGTFTTLEGTTETVAALRGRPTLLWFMTTWCSSCEAGTQAMAQHIETLAADGVRVVQVENYQDLGQSGPSLTTFAKTLAGAAFTNPDWTFGEASAALTHTYNPRAYLDIYYLINAQGKITYVNSSPGSTMPQLLSAAHALT